MSETENVTPTPAETTVESPSNPAAPTPEVLTRLRNVGEAGRRQWEQVFAFAGGVQLGRLRDEATAALERLRREGPFVRAQARGIELILSVLGRVRQGASALEESLRGGQSPAASDSPASAA